MRYAVWDSKADEMVAIDGPDPMDGRRPLNQWSPLTIRRDCSRPHGRHSRSMMTMASQWPPFLAILDHVDHL